MKVLYIVWKSYGNNGMMQAFRARGDELETFELDWKHSTTLNLGLAEQLVRRIAAGSFDMVYSYNYYSVVSLACNSCKVKYVSWVYDSPLVALYSNTIRFPYNYVFVFDRGQWLDLKKRGVDTVYHLPLAADVDLYDTYRMDAGIQEIFDAQISFIGSTYQERKNQLFRRLQGADAYTRGYLDGVIEAQKDIYGITLLEEMLTPEIMERILKARPWVPNEDGFEEASWVYANYHLARQIAAQQRKEILQMLSERYQTVLYTHEKTPFLPLVENRGQAGYYLESAYIYRCSKINLNISLRSIITGIPLRAFEIMGNGGFLLTNYQEEFEEHFVAGEDYDYYSSNEELMEKVEYYLSHEKERAQIARNGYEKVKKRHTYRNRLEEMMAVVWEGES
jgi:Uncharacterized protein conserved in bacteria